MSEYCNFHVGREIEIRGLTDRNAVCDVSRINPGFLLINPRVFLIDETRVESGNNPLKSVTRLNRNRERAHRHTKNLLGEARQRKNLHVSVGV